MSRSRINRAPMVLAAFVLLAILAAVWYSGSPASSGQNGGDCQQWCGNGSATVTMGGTTSVVSGGGCYDRGSDGVDARFGDWQGEAGVSGYLMLTAYRTDGPTPTPVPTANPLATPGETQYPHYNVSGSVGGDPFILDTDAVVTLNADGTGFYSGTDIDGNGLVTGTFNCG